MAVTAADVVVVGAGPVGLAVACGLLAHGVNVRVIDKASAPATTSRANFVHARGSEVLDRLGALGDLPERSVRAMKITTYLGGEPVMRMHFGDPGMQTAAPPMVISQAEVEAVLRDRLVELGGRVEWDTPLVGLRQDRSAVTAQVSGGTELRSPWLIGCDGTGSTTRRLAGIGFPGVRLSERFLLADVHLDWQLDRSGTTGWIHPDGMVGAMPMPDGLWRVIAYDPGPGDFGPGDLERLLFERTGHQVNVTGTVWLSEFRVHRRLADSYRRGRVLIAGDAGHSHAPFGGQGMLTGLGDAENLAFKLALVVDGRATAALLDTYQAERRPLATEVLRNTSAATKLNIADRGVGRFLRDRVVLPLLGLPRVQRWLTHQTSQLWVNYRGGPLAARSLPLRTPRPGDRIPDQRCVGADGQSTRLYEQLGGRWAVLGSGTGAGLVDAGLVDTARTFLGDDVVGLRGSETATGDAYLVRPDGHLAWRGRDAAGLADWLTSALTLGRVH
ncbi:FAD-dependent oxidoreductase [Mycolicibacterium thermoresistibile]